MATSLHATRGRTWKRYALAAAMLALAWLAQGLPLIRGFEWATYDRRVQLVSMGDEPVSSVVIIEIDDHSLEVFQAERGTWPWPRNLHGELIEYLSAARVTGVDVLYPEMRPRPSADSQEVSALVSAVASSSNVILATQFSEELSDLASPQAFSRMVLAADDDDVQRLPEHHHVVSPSPALLEASRGIGDVRMRRDADGTVRSYPAVERFQGRVYPSLALAVAAQFMGMDVGSVRYDDGLLQLGAHSLPLAEDGSFLFLPHRQTYQQISAADLLHSRQAEAAGETPEYPREFFRDKIVLVGVTADQIRPDEETPLRGSADGVFIHADAIDNLLRGVFFRKPPSWVNLGLMLAAILPAAIGINRPRPGRLVLLTVGLLVGFLVLVVFLAVSARIMVPMMGPVLAIAFSFTGLGTLSWAQEWNRRSHLETLELAKQQFTDMLVHDLRNTVAPIIMSLPQVGVGTRRDGSPATVNEAFLRNDFPEIVSTSTNKLMIQINALLDIRRMQEGRLKLRPQACSLRGLLEAVEEEYTVPASRAELQLKIDEQPGGDVQVFGDPAVLDRVLGNLIWNAIKYAGSASVIHLAGGDAGNGMARFSVTNSGMAIEAQVQKNLFSAFVTGPDAELVLDRIPSSGLGLTFCKLAVEAHGGQIALHSPISDRDDGVEVQFTIPIHPPHLESGGEDGHREPVGRESLDSGR